MKNLLKILKFILNHPIGKRSKVKSLFRFFYWQISSKLNFEISIFSFVDNTKLNILPRQTVATGNYYVGLLEFIEMSFVAHFLKEEDVFFDIGTNIGTYTIIASGVSKAKTYAFEPIPKTFNRLNANIKLNKLQDKVTAFNFGLSDKNEFLYFSEGLDAKNHIILNKKTKNKIEVKTLNEFKNAKPSLMKIDVEGYEKFVLEGGDEILKNNNLKAVIIEVNEEGKRYKVDNNTVHHILTSYGFCMYDYEPFSRNLKKTNQTNRDNRLYIRDIKHVSKCVKQAEKIKVAGIYI